MNDLDDTNYKEQPEQGEPNRSPPSMPLTLIDRKIAISIGDIGLCLTTLGNLLVRTSHENSMESVGGVAAGLERVCRRLRGEPKDGLSEREKKLVTASLRHRSCTDSEIARELLRLNASVDSNKDWAK